jgi:exodeoxyribonuclease VII large subunit
MSRHLEERRDTMRHLKKRLRDPHQEITLRRDQLRTATAQLRTAFQRQYEQTRSRLQELVTALNSLSPLAVLGRGYSLTRTIPGGKLVTDATALTHGELVHLTFAQGEARARVEEIIK